MDREAELRRLLAVERDQVSLIEVAIVNWSSDSMKSVVIATPLRARGIATATYFSGKGKKQMEKAKRDDPDFFLIIRDDGMQLKDAVYETFTPLTDENYVQEVYEKVVADWS
jgi:histidyl-tRNA synthetase